MFREVLRGIYFEAQQLFNTPIFFPHMPFYTYIHSITIIIAIVLCISYSSCNGVCLRKKKYYLLSS